MINSGPENSRPPQRGASREAKAVSSPPRSKVGVHSLLTPAARLAASFSWERSGGWAQAVPGARGDEPEQWPQRAEPWVSLHPSHAALLMGTAHSPHVGLQVALPPKNLWVVQWVWAQNQPLQEWGSTHEYWGDAGDAPAAPSTRFLQLVFPAPTCAEPRVAHTITQLY